VSCDESQLRLAGCSLAKIPDHVSIVYIVVCIYHLATEMLYKHKISWEAMKSFVVPGLFYTSDEHHIPAHPSSCYKIDCLTDSTMHTWFQLIDSFCTRLPSINPFP
jgi:hypothetical protein